MLMKQSKGIRMGQSEENPGFLFLPIAEVCISISDFIYIIADIVMYDSSDTSFVFLIISPHPKQYDH